jgi:hypothetical protein
MTSQKAVFKFSQVIVSEIGTDMEPLSDRRSPDLLGWLVPAQ